jgi:hypothetical protein
LDLLDFPLRVRIVEQPSEEVTMDVDFDARPDQPAPKRTQFETRGLFCSAHAATNGETAIALTGQYFPSLQLWDFGLMAKSGVSIAQMKELAEKINDICDGAYARFDEGRDMSGKEFYETDEHGLAKLE